MLGKLFSNAASSLTPSRGSPSPSRPSSSLDSVQEDIHTRNLIFPDAEALYAHQHDQVFPMTSSTVSMLTAAPTAFDTNPEIELEARDVRVVVMQEATSTFNSPALMYDSHPHIDAPACPVLNSGFATSGRGARSGRRREYDRHCAPHEYRGQAGGDYTGSAAIRSLRPAAERALAASREYREEIATIANCMFGASDVMAHKGTGSKVHILPTEPRGAQYPFEGHGSLGRSSMRSGSRLAQSFTSESIGGQSTGHGRGERKRVLVTRIFPVPLLSDSEEDTPSAYEGAGFPFPKADEKDKEREKEKKPKQKRTPMYAIGLVIQLPATQNAPSTPRSAYRGVGSYAENESVSSSFNSLRPSWTVLGSGFGVESLDSSFISDVDDRIDMVTQHWDIIIRTLDHLQAVASADILALLRQVDVTSPDQMGVGRGPHHTRTASISVAGKRVEENVKPLKPIRTNVKTIQLMPYALAYNQRLHAEIEYARHRIVGGIRNLQVITRQGRWGIWRDEARWVRKWAGGKEQGFFFYNLLTVFLGTHTEWLEAIGPTWYRRRNYKQQRVGRDEDMPIKARTVIVAADKMAARRLIFLLSAFLPNNQHHQVPFVRQFRPGTSVSGGAFSQSPPSYVPLNPREESLRRRVNRPKVKTTTNPAQPAPIVLANQVIEPHSHNRQPSDAPPTLPAGAMPVPTSYNPARQNGLATTSTATPIPALPHFSTRRPVRGTGPVPRPGSSGSLAADDLIRSLKRGDTAGSATSEESSSRWSGVLGSLWGGKRRGSTDVTVSSSNGGEERGKGEVMVHAQRRGGEGHRAEAERRAGELTSTTAPQPVAPSATQPIHPSGAYESPVKTSITEDGVIDIDVPLPSLFPSLPSALSSPSSSGILSSGGLGAAGPELDGFEHYTRSAGEDEAALNVGTTDGNSPNSPSTANNPKSPTLSNPPQPSLEDQIRAAMAAEPTPPLPLSAVRNGEEERWITVSTALIADTVAFTLKRIILRRLIRLPSSPPPSAGESAGNSYDGRASMYGNPYPGVLGTQSPAEGGAGGELIKEEWEVEMCISFDPALIEAVEKVMASPTGAAQNTPGGGGLQKPRSARGSKNPSAGSSAGSSRSGSRIRVVVPAPEPSPVPVLVSGGAGSSGAGALGNSGSGDGGAAGKSGEVREEEVPRAEVRTVLLSALEGIAGEVAEGRGATGVGGEGESYLREGVGRWLEGVDEGVLG
ncbi:hypothetical protein ACLOAV_005484 [Pseudogymnoascus australis]